MQLLAVGWEVQTDLRSESGDGRTERCTIRSNEPPLQRERGEAGSTADSVCHTAATTTWHYNLQDVLTHACTLCVCPSLSQNAFQRLFDASSLEAVSSSGLSAGEGQRRRVEVEVEVEEGVSGGGPRLSLLCPQWRRSPAAVLTDHPAGSEPWSCWCRWMLLLTSRIFR